MADCTGTDDVRKAQEQVRELVLTRDAMQSSIDSLKVLLSNERAQARAAKRRLVAAESVMPHGIEGGNIAEQIERLGNLLKERENEIEQLRMEESGTIAKDEKIDKVWEIVEEERGLRDMAEGKLKEELEALRQELEKKESDRITALRGCAEAERTSKEAIAREETLRQQLEGKDTDINDMHFKLREQATVSNAMKESLSEIPSLRSRVLELENERHVSDVLQKVLAEEEEEKELICEDETDSGESDAVKEKSLQLKVVRNIISAKDKIINDMSQRISHAESCRFGAVLACKVSEERAKNANQAICIARLEVEEAQRELSLESKSRLDLEQSAAKVCDDLETTNEELETLTEKVDEYELEMKANADSLVQMEQKLELAEENLVVARLGTSALELKLVDLQEEQKLHEDLRISVEERHKIAEEQRIEAVKEANNLKVTLEASEKKVADLEDIITKRSEIIDDLGTSSPCSTDPGAEERKMPTMSYSESMERLNELEEAASLAKSSYEQKCLEAHTLASSISENATTIVTLNRALLVSRDACDDKHNKLEKSMAKANALDRSLRKLKTELAARIEECDFLENRIRSELEPSLLKTNTQLDQRISELKVLREDFDLHKEMSEKNRVSLEKEVAGLSARLQETLTILSKTQTSLTESEERGADFEAQTATLADEKRKNLSTIEDLTSHCEHRHQALIGLEHRLLHIEKTVAEHEQVAFDANRDKQSLTRLLEEACDRLDVAEKRAARMDEIAHENEEKVEELMRRHSSMTDRLEDKIAKLEQSEHGIEELKQVLDFEHRALQSQAETVRNREALFESLSAELKEAIACRDEDLKIAQEDLQTTEERAISLTESLENVKEDLRKTESELLDSKQRHSDCQTEKDIVEVHLSEAQNQLYQLKTEYQAALDEIATKEQDIRDQLNSIIEQEGKIVALSAEKTDLEKQISEVRVELNVKMANEKELEGKAVALEGSLAKASMELEQCEEELSIRMTEVESLNSSVTNAQTNIAQLENALNAKEKELDNSRRAATALEESLARSKQQMGVMESHLDGHHTALKNVREKEEELAVKSGELQQATDYTADVEKNVEDLRQRLAASEAEMDAISRKLSSFEEEKSVLEEEVRTARDARIAAENALSCTSATLDAMEVSAAEEIQELKSTVISLRQLLDDPVASPSFASKEISQTNNASSLTTEQLDEFRVKNDRLVAKLTSTEADLSAKREALTTIEAKFQFIRDTLQKRDDEVERMERSLLDRNQALSLARSKIEDLTSKTATVARSEVLTLQTKLDAKEKAIANLHNWCCFINGKLHAAEKSLTERDMDLEESSVAFKKLETELQEMNDAIVEKDARTREIESLRVLELSELRSRIQSLQSHIEEANAKHENTELMMSPANVDDLDALLLANNELNECKTIAHMKDMEISRIQARNSSLEETVQTYEGDLSAAHMTMESLRLELNKLQCEVCDCREKFEKSAADSRQAELEDDTDTDFLVAKMRRTETELSTAKENAEKWQKRALELEPLAKSTIESQRTIEMMASRLSLAENESKQRRDLLQSKLDDANRERHVAEKDCVAAMMDCTALRNRMMEARRSGALSLPITPVSMDLCTVTFCLDGILAPKSDVAVHLLGADIKLGEWDSARRLVFPVIGVGTNGVIRSRDVVLPANLSTTYKFAADGADGKLFWEGGDNRILRVSEASSQRVHDTWRSSP